MKGEIYKVFEGYGFISIKGFIKPSMILRVNIKKLLNKENLYYYDRELLNEIKLSKEVDLNKDNEFVFSEWTRKKHTPISLEKELKSISKTTTWKYIKYA